MLNETESRGLDTMVLLLELRPYYVFALSSCTIAFHFFYVR